MKYSCEVLMEVLGDKDQPVDMEKLSTAEYMELQAQVGVSLIKSLSVDFPRKYDALIGKVTFAFVELKPLK